MSKSINPKFIKEFICHSDIKTIMRYIRPTDEDLKACLIRFISLFFYSIIP
jgi:integrase/recombinase XerD